MKKKQEDDNPDLILAHWENVWEEDDVAHDEQEELATEIEIEESARLLSSTPSVMTSSTSTSIESLTNFLEVWSRISLQNDKGLTTPVTSSKFKISSKGDNNNNDNENIIMMTMKLIFRPPKRYLSYKEQKSMEKNGAIPDRKNAKVDAWSPGGVQIEIIATKLQQQQKQQQRTNTRRSTNKDKDTRGSTIGIILRRCDIDGDTIIKRTTERAIIRRLDDAIRIWKKNN